MKSTSRLFLVPAILTLTPSVASADLLIVLNKSDHEAALVDPSTWKVVKKVATGTGPHEAAVSPDGRLAYVANYGAYRLFKQDEEPKLERGSTISVIDLTRREVVRTIDLGEYRMPHGIWTSRDGTRLWVTCEENRAVLEIETAKGGITKTWKTGQDVSHMLVPTPDETKLFVANIRSGSCTIINRKTDEVKTLATGNGAEGIDVSPDGREVWVTNRAANTISIIAAASDTIVAELKSSGDVPIRAKFTPDGRQVWVSCMRSNHITVYDAKSRAIIDTVAVDEAPIGIQMAADGKRAYIANTNANLITVVDVENRKQLGSFTTGNEPDGMAWAPKATAK
jgi:YVTN family beta-propeller protein